jgi:hypothetical protein
MIGFEDLLVTFRTIPLFLFCFQAITATQPNHFQLPMPGVNGIAAQTKTASENFAILENREISPSRASRKRAKGAAQTQTLTGIVEWEYKPLAWDCDVPNCDHFALYDDATQTNYDLDNARAALPFEGKRVKVTGIVNTKDIVIHVISIEAVK